MSIRITVGGATVEVDGDNIYAADGVTRMVYPISDLIDACARAADAARDARADTLRHIAEGTL